MTLPLYNNLYRLAGTTRLKFFINPRIIEQSTFRFCLNPMLYWFTVSDIPVKIDNTYQYLKNMDNKLYIKTITEYPEDGTLGSYHRDNKVSLNAAVNELIETAPYFKFIKPNSSEMRVNNKTLIVFNYGIINTRYIYNTNIMNPYFKWYNAFLRMITQVNSVEYKTDRHRYITFHIPPELPTRIELDKYATHLLSGHLNNLPTFPYFNVLDLWRFLTPELKSTSLLNKIPTSEYNNTTLLLMIDNKVVMLNMGVLAGIVDEYNFNPEHARITKIKASMARKVIYVMLLKIINSSGKSIDDVIKEPDAPADLVLNEKMFLDNDNYGKKEETQEIVNIDDLAEELEPIKTSTNNKPKDEIIIDEETGDAIEDDSVAVTSGEIRGLVKTGTDIKYESIEDVYKEKPNASMELSMKIGMLQDYGVYTKNKANKLNDILISQEHLPSPFPGDSRPLKEILDPTKDDYSINTEYSDITDNIVIKDKKSNRDVLGAITRKYVKEQITKDIARTVYSLQSADIVVESHTVTERANILGAFQEHSFRIIPLDGEPSTIKIPVPIVKEDGTFKLSGNTYRMRWQRIDFPIRKIDSTTVALTTNYGKLFVNKATYKKNDTGYWIKNYIFSRYEKQEGITDLVIIPIKNVDCVLPKLYNLIARYIKAFKTDGIYFSFDYNFRYTLFNNLTLEDVKLIEKDKYVLIGSMDGKQVYIDFEDNLLIRDNDKLIPYKSLYDVIGLSKDILPEEFTTVKVFKRNIPTVLLLTYYLGFNNLLNILKSEYTVEEFTGMSDNGSLNNIREKNIPGTMRFIFKNKILRIKRDYDKGDLILSGLDEVRALLRHVDYEDMLDVTAFESVLARYGLPYMYTNEIKLMGTMYVDHISARLLEKRNEPITFTGLLLRANDLLLDDNYKHPNSISDMVIRGYDRIPGMMYTELVRATREHQNRSYWSKSRLVLPDFKLIANIQEDSTTVLVDDLNPIASLKQVSDVTYTGLGGRSKESMSKDTRQMHPSEVGIISEATKDSGDVGISAYMTASPNIDDIRGLTKSVDVENASWSELLTDNGLLSPFSINDDAKRVNFSTVQASHIIPLVNGRVPYVRTGHDANIAIKVKGKFATIAEDSGVVKNVSKDEIVVNYDNLGIKKYPIYKWTSKEESGACYTHELVPNLIVGDTFIKDDTLVYDKMFFEPDIFNRKRVIYKQGTMARIALIDDTDTLEDSGGVTKKMCDVLATDVTKYISNVINATDNILGLVSINDKVTSTTPLYSITDESLGDTSTMDSNVLSILQELKMSTPKAYVNGVISDIVVYYNCELDDMSPTLKKVAIESDKKLMKIHGFPGKVNSSYSIQGKPLLNGEVEIKVYIKTPDKMGVGDKAILANQLKFTVGTVADYDVVSEDGKEVDLWFATRSIAARIVTSPYLIGTTSTVLDVLKNRLVERYKSIKK